MFPLTTQLTSKETSPIHLKKQRLLYIDNYIIYN